MGVSEYMARKYFRTSLVLALGVLIGAIVTLGQGVWATDNSTANLPLGKLRSFVHVMNIVEQNYVEKVDDDKLLTKAMRGMVGSLDPHSVYLDPEQYKEMHIDTSGQFGGLGIQVQMENGYIRVISPIDDTPAAKAGIKAGDLIIRINGTAVKGLNLHQAVVKMRGKPGTEITLTVLRKGANKPLTFHITRAIIHVKSVKSHMLRPGYGYLRISQFNADTAKGVKKNIEDLLDKHDGHLKGLVLDLRNNPGGLLKAAVSVSDDFINAGAIVSIQGRTTDSNKVFSADQGDLLDAAPIVVLVNGGTASAAEIVSGALQDHDRAIIAGLKTFGKGSVQTILPLKDGAAIKLTTARYYTPSGRSIQARGIRPDVILHPLAVKGDGGTSFTPIKESDLLHRLDNNTKAKAGEGESVKKLSAQKLKLAEKDFQLYAALNLLKGINVAKKVSAQ